MVKIILFVLALMLLTACRGTRDRRTASYDDPCEHRPVEASKAEELKGDVRALSRKAYPEPAPDAIEDSAAEITAESLLVQKEDLLAMTMQSMQQNAQACASRSRGYDEENL